MTVNESRIVTAHGIFNNIVKEYDNGVRVGILKTDRKIGTIFPDADLQP